MAHQGFGLSTSLCTAHCVSFDNMPDSSGKIVSRIRALGRCATQPSRNLIYADSIRKRLVSHILVVGIRTVLA
jgi:hypothetical protein